jgi:hypothetical protein
MLKQLIGYVGSRNQQHNTAACIGSSVLKICSERSSAGGFCNYMLVE